MTNRYCPKCKKMSRFVKTGIIWVGTKKKQRFQCRKCGYNTTFPKKKE